MFQRWAAIVLLFSLCTVSLQGAASRQEIRCGYDDQIEIGDQGGDQDR